MEKNAFEYLPVLKALVLSTFKGQYKNSHLGWVWQFLNPTILVVLFYVVFTSVRIVSAHGDYWLLLCTGIFPYMFIENSIVSGSMCLVYNSQLIKKMAFPRTIIVIAHIIVGLISFSIVLILTLLLAIISNHYIELIHILALVPLTIVTIIFCLGIAHLLSAIVVYFRDLGHFITAISRLIFWTSPTIYTIYDVSGILHTIMCCNPITYFVAQYQELIYFDSFMPTNWLLTMIALSICIYVAGRLVFKRLENGFAERL
ncbi:lipopolysaccharide transport system permease protein [Methanoculleus sp. CAG:1088]|nr:lipopolysaccharide transport system permease protein [Methanoculleus sp. CAG:1088]